MMKKKIISLIILILIFFSGILFYINKYPDAVKLNYFKSLLSDEQKYTIKRYIFPRKLITEKELSLSSLRDTIDKQRIGFLNSEIKFKKGNGIITTTDNEIRLSNNQTLQKYILDQGFYSGIYNNYPGSGYIDFFENKLIIISSRGILAHINLENLRDGNFRQIKNNINEFMKAEQMSKDKRFSLKDLFIHNNKIFISFTEEIKKDCWNTSIIYGDINFEKINFKKIFSPDECVDPNDNVEEGFNPHSAGGRMVSFDPDHILLTIGDYRKRYLAQDNKSINGKIIKLNIDNGKYEIVTKGHRNPQGLYFDKENNFMLETEHGPQGGDEINLIEVNKMNKDNVLNYGWPIASYGEHYGGIKKSNDWLYAKYPLLKSHSENGFIEPLKFFVPSIAISQIVKIKNQYVVSSLRDKSIYFFKLNNQKEIINFERVEVFERVRDLNVKNNKLYLFLEDTASVGVIDFD